MHMTSKASQVRVNAGLFLDHPTEHLSPKRRSQRRKRAGLIDGIVDGERVLIATPPRVPLEREVEIQIRVALSAAGHIVWKHTVEPCVECGKRPTKRTGLGEGASDLIVIHRLTGRFVGIEVKRPGYSPSDVRPMQRKWLATVLRFGGITGIATSPEEAMAIMRRASQPSGGASASQSNSMTVSENSQEKK